MTPGQRYLRLLRIEYAELVRIAKANVDIYEYSLEHYVNSEVDRERILKDIEDFKKDVDFYGKALTGLGGAENEEILTESKLDSESPSKFVGITCTTVL
jgi:hypothetical protein